MPFISLTRLRVKSIFYLVSFFRANESSVKEIMSSDGLIQAKELLDKNLTFWTLTMWEDEHYMKKFRISKAHRTAMQHLSKWCDEASYHHWLQDSFEFESWEIVSEKLFKEGRLSKLRNPSIAQLNNKFPPIKWTKTQRVLK